MKFLKLFFIIFFLFFFAQIFWEHQKLSNILCTEGNQTLEKLHTILSWSIVLLSTFCTYFSYCVSEDVNFFFFLSSSCCFWFKQRFSQVNNLQRWRFLFLLLFWSFNLIFFCFLNLRILFFFIMFLNCTTT